MESVRRVSEELGSLLGLIILNGIVILAGFICLIIPGIYLACRLLVCVPAALIERRGPRDSLSRSFRLTIDSAGRAFVIAWAERSFRRRFGLNRHIPEPPFDARARCAVPNGGPDSRTPEAEIVAGRRWPNLR
jgi:hypothetical protein